MSNFQCEYCHTDITEGPDGHYVTGCMHYPIEKLVNIRSPFDCEKEGGHIWDGKPITFRMGMATGGSATCSRCGIVAIDYDMARR